MTDDWEIGQDEPLVEEGFYTAKVTKIEDTKGQWGPRLRVFFELEDEAVAGIELSKFVSPPQAGKILRRMALYALADALLGDLEAWTGEHGKVSRADLIGKRCRIRVEEQPLEDGSIFSKVTGFSRLKEKPRRAVKAEAVPDEEPATDEKTLLEEVVERIGEDKVFEALDGLAEFVTYSAEGKLAIAPGTKGKDVVAVYKKLSELKK